MITLKEYEIYLKVKKFIKTIDCDESSIIKRIINKVLIIPAYVQLIIESDDMEPTKYYSLSAAARGCGLLKQMIIYAYRNRSTRIVGDKAGSRCVKLSGWIDFIWDEINSFQNFGIFEILNFSKFWDLRCARILAFEIFAPKLCM